MNVRWLGLSVVALLVVGIVVVKYRSQSLSKADDPVVSAPEVILVADMSEAGGEDGCAKIIEAVQAAQERRVKAVILSPDENSPLLRRYRVLTSPTVLFLDSGGNVTSRFEGESPEVIGAIQDQLVRLPGGG